VSVHDVARPVEMVAVAIDVGKNTVALSVTDDQRRRLLGPLDFAMTRPGLAATVVKIEAVVPSQARVRVGVEAAGHYHQPLLVASSWPAGWELRELMCPSSVGSRVGVGSRPTRSTWRRSPSWC
jgi:transposase